MSTTDFFSDLDLDNTTNQTSKQVLTKYSKKGRILISLGIVLAVILFLASCYVLVNDPKLDLVTKLNLNRVLNLIPTETPEIGYALKNKTCFTYEGWYYCTNNTDGTSEKLFEVTDGYIVTFVSRQFVYIRNNKLVAFNPELKVTKFIYDGSLGPVTMFNCLTDNKCILQINEIRSGSHKLIIWENNAKSAEVGVKLNLELRNLTAKDSFSIQLNKSQTNFIYTNTLMKTNGKTCTESGGSYGELIISDLNGNYKSITNCMAGAFWKDDTNIIYQHSGSFELIEYNVDDFSTKVIGKLTGFARDSFFDNTQILNVNSDTGILYYTLPNTDTYSIYSYDLSTKKEVKLIDNAYPIGLAGNNELLIGLYRNCEVEDVSKCMIFDKLKEVYDYKVVKSGVVSDTRILSATAKVERDPDNNYADIIRQIVTRYQPNDGVVRINVLNEN